MQREGEEKTGQGDRHRIAQDGQKEKETRK
jgi:hypothetical protein